jgi:hypothetical protein
VQTVRLVDCPPLMPADDVSLWAISPSSSLDVRRDLKNVDISVCSLAALRVSFSRDLDAVLSWPSVA